MIGIDTGPYPGSRVYSLVGIEVLKLEHSQQELDPSIWYGTLWREESGVI